MSELSSFRFLSLLGCLLWATSTAFAGGPPIPVTPSPTGIAAIWSQIVGHAVDPNNPDSKVLSSFRPPIVEMRFVLAGKGRSCGEYSVWYRTSSNGAWKLHASPAIERAKPDFGGYDWSHFSMTLCRVVTDTTWFDAGVSSSTSKFMPEIIWAPPTSAIGSRKAVVTSQVAAAGSIGRQNPGTDQIVMITLGDTGCRGLPSGESGRKLQACKTTNNHDNKWFFPDLMEKVTKVALDDGTTAKPDFFIHVGDYRYFWEDYKDFDNHGSREHSLDSLEFWLQEFLTPAQEALTIAPWALARGNHEVCWRSQWYGHGWRYLFGNADWPNISCNNLVPTEYFDVGPNGGSDKNTRHRVVVFDNSEPGTSKAQDRLNEAAAATYGPNGLPYVASNHWASHVPSVAYMSFCKGQCGHNGRNRQNDTALSHIQTALGKFGKGPVCQDRGKGLPRCVPSTLFAGHQHFFERIRMWEKDASGNQVWAWPQMYVVGHGGTKKDGTGLGTDTKCRTKLGLPSTSAKKYESDVWADIRHGFVVWRRAAGTLSNPSGWAEKQYWHTPATVNNSGDCPF